MSLSLGNSMDPNTRPAKKSEPNSPNSLFGAQVRPNYLIQLFSDLVEFSTILYLGKLSTLYGYNLAQKSKFVHSYQSDYIPVYVSRALHSYLGYNS